MRFAGLAFAMTLESLSLQTLPTFPRRAFEAMTFDTYGPETAFCETVAEVKMFI